jgi:CRP-like cAMP-binding protein
MLAAEIESIPLFAQLTPEDRERVAAVAKARHFDPGFVAVNEGEFAFNFYAISQGAAEVRRAGAHVTGLGPGDFFGELGVVPGISRPWTRRRSASVIVTEPTEAIVIDGNEFRRLTNTIRALRDAVSAAVSERADSAGDGAR